ncbi:NAD(P)H-dependent glycerol-3-phosphate dehydrogenase [Mycoplasma sp. 1654_15]|uniref:NAD(P)H-dependent glycerol-3-phosphate dehydrogenase n=1 Tax=Mycoplasma sp. 1654_15 TaxID=2725994 RepID=UPI00144A2BC8|nr:NAD(P)H-dependent glycerol-3-phosphate dehydrogenase [Mycoplasma sp. 1654_15]QJB71259.1 NAD(P)H-dependent glycerol-3-phosphate dehydrogenase [Mycoplasma sp. 1654_15]
MKHQKVSIIGSGAMGTAIAKVIYDSGYKNVWIYGIDNKELEQLSQGKNTKYFPETVKIPCFNTSSDLKKVLDNSSYVVIALPSKVVDVVLEQILLNLNSNVYIINASKGFYPNSFLSLQQGIRKASSKNKYVKEVISLLGPSHAEEIIKSAHTLVCLVNKDLNISKQVQPLFNNSYFRTYLLEDEIGAEVGSAYKNILAIASGMLFAKGFGINTVAAFLTRGLSEARKFNAFLGGKESTLMGLTGLGDLIVTALSDLSRNYSFGLDFIKNKENALKTSKTVEGLTALDSVIKIAKNKHLDLPIIFSLYDIIYNNQDFESIVEKLWARKLKQED